MSLTFENFSSGVTDSYTRSRLSTFFFSPLCTVLVTSRRCGSVVVGRGRGAPNTYEVPRCQETDAPSERILPIFFRCAAGQAQSASGNVFRLHGRLLVHQRDGTTPCLRVSRHQDGGDRACWEGALRPRNVSVPSYRPPHTRGGPSACTREAQGRVRGSPRHPAGTCAPHTGAGAGVQATAPGQGPGPLGAEAGVDARGAAWPSPVARRRPA